MVDAREHFIRADNDADSALVAYAGRRIVEMGSAAARRRLLRALIGWTHDRFLSGEPDDMNPTEPRLGHS